MFKQGERRSVTAGNKTRVESSSVYYASRMNPGLKHYFQNLSLHFNIYSTDNANSFHLDSKHAITVKDVDGRCEQMRA